LPVIINIDTNIDDTLTTIILSNIEVTQKLRVIFDETHSQLTRYWIRTGFCYIGKKNNDFLDQQIEAINLGIQEANNKLIYPIMHNDKIYTKTLEDIKVL